MTYTGAMVLPQNAVVMQEEEMRYLEGGKYYGVNLTKKQCNRLAYNITAMGGILTISSLVCYGVAFIPGFQYAVAAAKYYGALATVAGLTSWFFTEAARKGGCYVGFDSKKKKIVYGYGKR